MNTNPESEELEVSCAVKVHPKFYIENIVPSTGQSSRRRSKRNINKEQNVRTGPCEMGIEEGSYVPKDKDTSKQCSSANTIEEVERDAKANLTNSSVKRTDKMKKSLKKDDSKIKTQKTAVCTKTSKKRSRTEEASTVTNKLKVIDLFSSFENETNGNNNSEKKTTWKEKTGPSSENSEIESDLVNHVNVMNDESCLNNKNIGLSDNEDQSKESKKRDSEAINSNIRQKRKRKSDTFKSDDLELIKKRQHEFVSRSPDIHKTNAADTNNREVHIKIVDRHGLNEISVSVKKNSRLLKTKTKEHCADKFGKSVDSLRFVYKGWRINDSDTPAHFGLSDGDVIEASEDSPAHFGLGDADVIEAPEDTGDGDVREASDLRSLNSAEPEDETERLRAELVMKEKELIHIKRKLLLKESCRTRKKTDGEGDAEGVQSHHKHEEASIKDTASHKSNLIEIRSDEETEYIEHIPNDVEQEESVLIISDEQSYNYVCIEMETMLASNSRSKEITQIGAFKEKSICNADARFFKAIVPKNLDYYLENYKLGGDLLQTLHMRKNYGGNFEFRKQFEILDEGRVATQCVGEEEALEELSSYLAAVENCIIVSLNEENVKLLVNKIKLLGITNKRIHMDSVTGFCTWSSYLKESGASKEDLNQEFEDWYDDYVDSGYFKESSSSETVQKHADVVAKMVHDSITALLSLSHILVKASRPIKSLLPNQTPEDEQPDSEIHYLELYSSLRHDFPVTIPLQKLETYDISSEDEEKGDARCRNIRRGLFTKTRSQELKDHSADEQETEIDEVELHIDTSMEDATETTQDEQSIPNQSDGSALKCQHCRKSFTTYEEKTAHVSKCNPRQDQRTRCPICSKEFFDELSEPAIIRRNEHIINEHDPNNFDKQPILPLEFQCQKCYVWFSSLSRNLFHRCLVVDPKTPLFYVENAKDSVSNITVQGATTQATGSKSVPNVPRKRITFESLPSAPTKDTTPIENVPATVHSANAMPALYRVQSANKTCPVCNKTFQSEKGRNQHIVAKHNPNNSDQLPILPLELQCQKCYSWFPTVKPKHNQRCFKENPKIPLFLKCQHCNRSFKTYQEKTVHTLKCNSKIATKYISANPVPNDPTKETTPVGTVKRASKTDATQSKTVTVHKRIYGPLQSTRGYMDHNFPSDVPGYNHQRTGSDNFRGAFGRVRQPHPQADLASRGFGRFPRPQADLASRGFGRFPHPQADLASRGFGRFPHPQADLFNRSFGGFHHPQVDPVNARFGRFPHPQAGPILGGVGRFPHPQADPINGEFGEFHHPQVGPANGGFGGRFPHPEADPVNGEFREFHHPQVGPSNGGFGGLFPHPQAVPANGGFGEFGEFNHPQDVPVNGGFGRFPHPQAEHANEEFGNLLWKFT